MNTIKVRKVIEVEAKIISEYWIISYDNGWDSSCWTVIGKGETFEEALKEATADKYYKIDNDLTHYKKGIDNKIRINDNNYKFVYEHYNKTNIEIIHGFYIEEF